MHKFKFLRTLLVSTSLFAVAGLTTTSAVAKSHKQQHEHFHVMQHESMTRAPFTGGTAMGTSTTGKPTPYTFTSEHFGILDTLGIILKDAVDGTVITATTVEDYGQDGKKAAHGVDAYEGATPLTAAQVTTIGQEFYKIQKAIEGDPSITISSAALSTFKNGIVAVLASISAPPPNFDREMQAAITAIQHAQEALTKVDSGFVNAPGLLTSTGLSVDTVTGAITDASGHAISESDASALNKALLYAEKTIVNTPTSSGTPEIDTYVQKIIEITKKTFTPSELNNLKNQIISAIGTGISVQHKVETGGSPGPGEHIGRAPSPGAPPATVSLPAPPVGGTGGLTSGGGGGGGGSSHTGHGGSGTTTTTGTKPVGPVPIIPNTPIDHGEIHHAKVTVPSASDITGGTPQPDGSKTGVTIHNAILTDAVISGVDPDGASGITTDTKVTGATITGATLMPDGTVVGGTISAGTITAGSVAKGILNRLYGDAVSDMVDIVYRPTIARDLKVFTKQRDAFIIVVDANNKIVAAKDELNGTYAGDSNIKSEAGEYHAYFDKPSARTVNNVYEDWLNKKKAYESHYGHLRDTIAPDIKTTRSDLDRTLADAKVALASESDPVKIQALHNAIKMAEGIDLDMKDLDDKVNALVLHHITKRAGFVSPFSPSGVTSATTPEDKLIAAIAAAKLRLAAYKRHASAITSYEDTMKTYLEAVQRMDDIRKFTNMQRAEPLFTGRMWNQIIRDYDMVNQHIFTRHVHKMQGLWANGDIFIHETDLQLRNHNKETSKDTQFSMGYDQYIDEKSKIGFFFTVNGNHEHTKPTWNKQVKSNFTLGAYGSYDITPEFYLYEKFAMSHVDYDNRIHNGPITSTSEIDTKSFNNEFTVGYHLDKDTAIEGYLNAVFMKSLTFEQLEKNRGGFGLYNGQAHINSTLYSAIGLRGFISHSKSIIDRADVVVTPYSKGFIEAALSGTDMKGKSTRLGLTKKATFEELKEFRFGLAVGLVFFHKDFKDVTSTIGYHMDHYGNTAHTVNFSMNINL